MITPGSPATRRDSSIPHRNRRRIYVAALPALRDAVRREDANISNVIVSNDCSYLWLFENPSNAHTKYFKTTGSRMPSRTDLELWRMRRECFVTSS
jgi:hypothetical protein